MLLTNRAIPEVEPLCGVPLYLRMEVDQKRSDGVLVGLADAFPQAVIALHNLVPLHLGPLCALPREPVRQQLPDCPRLQPSANTLASTPPPVLTL